MSKRANASREVNRRGSRRAIFDFVEVNGEKFTRRRARAIRRAAARVKTPRAVRREVHENVRLQFLQDKYIEKSQRNKQD